MDLTDVLQRVLAGDRRAYAEVVSHYERSLFGFLGKMGLSQMQSEDIAQETFLRAWTHLADFDSCRAGFSTWLFTIARRLALNELGRAGSRQEQTLPDHDQPGESLEPSAMLMLTEKQQQLRQALLTLNESDRTTLALACIREMSLADIASIEGSSVGAIKTRLHRARSRLRALMNYDAASRNDE